MLGKAHEQTKEPDKFQLRMGLDPWACGSGQPCKGVACLPRAPNDEVGQALGKHAI